MNSCYQTLSERVGVETEFSVRITLLLSPGLQVLKPKITRQKRHVPLKISHNSLLRNTWSAKSCIKHTAKYTQNESFLVPTSGKFPTNYTRLAEDLIPAAAFVAKALTGSGFRAYLFILERASERRQRVRAT